MSRPLGLLIAIWLAAGVAMTGARVPSLDPEERLARAAALNPASIRVAPPETTALDRLSLLTLEGRPVYRMTGNDRTWFVFADTGDEVPPVDAGQALRIARAFAGGHVPVHYEARLLDADPWTFAVRARLPLHRIAVGDPAATRLYVAEHGGDVVMKTTAAGRGWGASVAVLLGRLQSMAPGDGRSGAMPGSELRDRLAGGPIETGGLTADRIRRAVQAYSPRLPKEIELVRFRGGYYASAAAGIVSLAAPHLGAAEQLPPDLVVGAASVMMPGVPIDGLYWMDSYDAYYDDRHGRPSLPVLRVRYRDPRRTWVYIDPRRGTIARTEDRWSRFNRWRYLGVGLVLLAATLPAAWRRVRAGGYGAAWRIRNG